MKRIKCFLSSVAEFFKSGKWSRHTYLMAISKCIVVTNNSTGAFRVSNGYAHSKDETVHTDGGVLYGTCLICGKTQYSWVHSFDDFIGGDSCTVLGKYKVENGDIEAVE